MLKLKRRRLPLRQRTLRVRSTSRESFGIRPEIEQSSISKQLGELPAPVAQGTEQRPSKPLAEGSNPSGRKEGVGLPPYPLFTFDW